jgi:hypothetical protein
VHVLGLVPAKLRFVYHDASADPLAPERCEIPAARQAELARAGFERLGYTLAVLAMNGAELVHEIWMGSDGRVLVELEARSGRADLVTLFEDGTIVKTIERQPLLDWIFAAPGTTMRARDRVLHASVGGPLERVIARHAARVAEVEKRAAVFACTTMQGHFASRLRIAELRDARMYLHLVLAVVIAVVVAIASAIALRHALGYPQHPPPPVRLMLVVAAFIVMIPAHFVAKWFVAPYVVPWFAGPPPSPASELFARAKDVPPGRVYR